MSNFSEPTSPFVLIAHPGDIDSSLLRQISRSFEVLRNSSAIDQDIYFKAWGIEDSDDGLSQWRPAQMSVPLPSPPHCRAVVSIFSERIGSPLSLPDNVDLERLLGDELRTSTSNGEHLKVDFKPGDEKSGAFPLTGTVFETLVALASSWRSGCPEDGRPPMQVLFIGDDSILHADDPINANWGERSLSDRAEEELTRSAFFDWVENVYQPQISQLQNFLRYLQFRTGWNIEPVRKADIHEKVESFLRKWVYPTTAASRTNPFKGLDHYDSVDSKVFFGRGAWLTDAISTFESLWSPSDRLPFFGIVGGSGAGKSSLLRAGIVAHLERDSVSHYKTVVLAASEMLGDDIYSHPEQFRPDRPITTILKSVLRQLEIESETDNLEHLLADEPIENLVSVSKTFLFEKLHRFTDHNGNPYRLVIGLDQFEELIDYHFSLEGEGRLDRFFQFISQTLLQGRIGYIYTCQTNRTKLRDKIAPLCDLVRKGHDKKVGFPTEEDLKSIAVGSFRCVNMELSPDFIHELYSRVDMFERTVLGGTRQHPDGSAKDSSLLPLFSVALKRIYDGCKKQLADYASQQNRISAPEITGHQQAPAGWQLSKEQAEESGTLTQYKVELNDETRPLLDVSEAISSLGEKSLKLAREGRAVVWHDEILHSFLRRLVRVQEENVYADSVDDGPQEDQYDSRLDLPRAARPIRGPGIALVDAMIENRLLVPVERESVRLVHEAVITHWPDARKWLDQEKDLLKIAQELLGYAKTWYRKGGNIAQLGGATEDELDKAGYLLRDWLTVFEPTDGSQPHNDYRLLFKYCVALLEAKLDPSALAQGKDSQASHFLIAVSYGLMDLVQKYLEVDSSLAQTHRTSAGANAVYCAVLGNIETLKLVIENGADVTCPNEAGWLPVHIATHLGKIDALERLISAKADCAAGGPNESTCLHIAAQNSDLDVLEFLLDQAETSPDAVTADGWTPLHLALRYAAPDVIQSLLDHNVQVSLPTAEGWTPLHIATRYCDSNMSDALIERGANVNPDREQSALSSPLQLACMYAQPSTVELLLCNGAEVNCRNKQGSTALDLACARGSLPIVELFLDAESVELEPGKSAATPLQNAIRSGMRECVERLLEDDRIDWHARDSSGRSILEQAIFVGEDFVLELLLETLPSNALTELADSGGRTALHFAADKGDTRAISMLLEHRADPDVQIRSTGKTPLHLAVESGNVDAIRQLASASKSHVLDTKGQTPLHKAVTAEGTDATAALLDTYRADVRDRRGLTPLHVAAQRGRKDIVSLFADRVAESLAWRDEYGRLPLHYAAENNCIDIASYLSQHFDADLGDEEGLRPLHLAAKGNHADIVSQLLSSGARVNESDNFGWTPLHAAAQSGAHEVCRILLRHGAEVDARSKEPAFTPLQAAAETGQLEVLDLLLEHGACIGASDDSGVPAVVLAARTGQYPVVERLISRYDNSVNNDWIRNTVAKLLNEHWQRGNTDGKPTTAEKLDLAQRLGKLGLHIDSEPSDEAPLSNMTTHISEILRRPVEVSNQESIASLGFSWNERPPPELSSLAKEVDPIDGRLIVDRTHGQLFESRLPWYDNVVLLRLTQPNWKELSIYFLQTEQKKLYRLNGTSPAIHEVNKKAPIKLNSDNVLQYLRFFGFFVRGEEGPFYVLERADDPLLTADHDKPSAKWLKDTVRPATLRGINQEGSFLCDAVVFYSNALFSADFEVKRSGLIAMLDDEPIAVDLPLKIQAPIA